jgi:L-threonylcarbamoyladenylate synthase
MQNDIQQAIQIIIDGGIGIFPTDTAFGIGCRIDNESAVSRLFRIRKRPVTQAAPVLVNSIDMAQSYLKPINDDVLTLMKKYWPGALTIVYPCIIEKVPSLVRGGGTTLGVRQPKSDITQKLIDGVNVPILGPSANFHAEKAVYRKEDLNLALIDLVDFVIEGETTAGNVSTVIDCSQSPWKILREGAVKVEEVNG